MNTDNETKYDVITAITVLFAFMNNWEQKIFTKIAYWSKESFSVAIKIFDYSLRTVAFLGRTILKATIIVFVIEIIFMLTIMWAQQNDTYLSWAYLETLKILFRAFLEELAVIQRYIIYLQLQ